MGNYVYSDMDARLTHLKTGTIQVRYDADVILQSIKNILATVTGERVRNPIGSTLIKLLFEPINDDTAEDIEYQVRDILKWEPRMVLRSLRVVPVYDQNVYELFISYIITGVPGTQTFNTKLKSLYG